MSNNKTMSIANDLLATVQGGYLPINTVANHKPGTDWGKVGQAAWKGVEATGPASGALGLLPGAHGKILSGAVMAGSAYYGAANEYLAQQKKLK